MLPATPSEQPVASRASGPAALVVRRARAGVACVAVVPIIAVGLAACGRSAPETAEPVAGEQNDPAVAGVQVVSDAPVVTPGPTTSTTATVTTTPVVTSGSYMVEPGDTLSGIAQEFGVTVAALSEANGITDVDTIRPGQELVIPG